MTLKKLTIATVFTAAFLLTACDGSKKESSSTGSQTLKVGVISGPELEVAEVAKTQAKEMYDLDVELVVFDDYVTPNQALSDGLIDVNAFQHKPYLDQQIKERGYKLDIVGNTFVYPIAAYSHKLQPVTETDSNTDGVIVNAPNGNSYLIKPNSTVAIPNDPTNLGRSLLLLQNQGLITVDPEKGLLPSVIDITSNPYNLNILEIDAPMLPRSLDDAQVDFAIINNAFAGQANLTPAANGIFVEGKESPYVNIIVTTDANKNSQNVQNFVKAYQTQAVSDKANEVFNGGAVQGW